MSDFIERLIQIKEETQACIDEYSGCLQDPILGLIDALIENERQSKEVKIITLQENRKSFTIEEESVPVKSLRTKMLVPKKQLSKDDLAKLRDLIAHPEKWEGISESIIRQLNRKLLDDVSKTN